mgnify:CR=1 FL=1
MLQKNSKRLESIKAAHKTRKVSSTTREEDYLEVIAELVELKGYATTLDISRYMNVSPPSVTKMLQKLDEKKYIEYEKYHGINLTNNGRQVADSIRRKHSILLEFFEILNIGQEIANQDTEGLEHHFGLVEDQWSDAIEEWSYWVGSRSIAPSAYTNGRGPTANL